MSSCCINFDSGIAYIVDNPNDKPIKSITISEYLINIDLQLEIKNGLKYLVCEKGGALIKYKSDKVKSRFFHKCDFTHDDSKMTEWHKEWETHFENTEISIGNRRADAIVGKNVLEFQHSNISLENVTARSADWKKFGYKIHWIIDCNNAIEISELYNNSYLITFKIDAWKYEHFTCEKYIYLNIDDKIFKINPNKVKSNMIDVNEYKLKSLFIESLSMNINIWDDIEIVQCSLYHNQRGAGCGKTFESIQLLENEETFKHKTTFIYLTKMHSAKEVIFNELKEQYIRRQLSNLDIPEEGMNDIGKQYKINYKNNITGNDCNIIIGTIDSFMYALGNKTVKDRDYFGGIVNSIKEGFLDTTKNGTIKYAQQHIILNKNCLIIIDEAQDLGPEYIEAVCKIMKNTYIDTYVIGDKLQSIWGEHNIHTFLEHNDLPNVEIKRSSGVNNVMRFHNIQFKDFVNKVIDFSKYDLPPIENICNGTNCKYKHTDEIEPYHIFEIEKIYPDDNTDEYNEDKIDKVIEKIIGYMNNEIETNNYLPNNFMFIFPILTKNCLANRLESRIQEFWITKFKDINYKENVLNNNEYWKDKLDSDEYYKYIYLHKNSEGKSINLTESENATRILSIHASKGNGCEVVFLLGLDEMALKIFSKKTGNLVYDSLLHVAITRQKKSLYIGLTNKNDDIKQKFKDFKIEKDITILPRIEDINCSCNYTKIISKSFEHVEFFKQINENIIIPNEYEKLLPINTDSKKLIDWGHHLIRYYVFLYNFKVNIHNNEIVDILNDKNMNIEDRNKHLQFITILNKILKQNINCFDYKSYYIILKEIKESKTPHHIPINIIPILRLQLDDKTKYYKYANILQSFMKHIQNKLKEDLKQNKLPYLCPLETIILYHMIQVMDQGVYAEITIMDIYSIMYCYEECYNSVDHSICNCLCQTCFFEKSNPDNKKYKEIRESIVNHYENTKKLKVVYENYKMYISEKFGEVFTYNIHHRVSFDSNNNFNINDEHSIIAYSENYVIFFIIKPQFNKLNFNEVIFNEIFKKYMLLNIKTECKNYNRYAGKQIIACILTLDSEIPIFYNFDIEKDNLYITQCIKDSLFKIYSEHHDLVFDYYNYWKENKSGNKETCIKYIHDKLEKTKSEYLKDYKKKIIPKYIIEYFYDLNKELSKSKQKQLVLDKVNNKEIFLSELAIKLEEAINDYIGIQLEMEDCDF